MSDNRGKERLRIRGRKRTLIYEIIRKLIGGYFFEGHNSTKVRTLALEERSRGRKTTFFWESLVLISSARGIRVNASGDDYQILGLLLGDVEGCVVA